MGSVKFRNRTHVQGRFIYVRYGEGEADVHGKQVENFRRFPSVDILHLEWEGPSVGPFM